jgi:DNA-binding transcriptional regulator YiaG
LKGYVDRGWTIEDVARHYRRHHPDRIRTVSIPVPGKYSPTAIKKLRASLGMSQPIFAQWLGVSAILVQSWERGVRTPSPLARRLLDTISTNPTAWLASFRRAG